MPKAEALSSKPRRDVFQDENTEAMTASLQFATLKGCAAAGGSANKGLKIVERIERWAIYGRRTPIECSFWPLVIGRAIDALSQPHTRQSLRSRFNGLLSGDPYPYVSRPASRG